MFKCLPTVPPAEMLLWLRIGGRELPCCGIAVHGGLRRAALMAHRPNLRFLFLFKTEYASGRVHAAVYPSPRGKPERRFESPLVRVCVCVRVCVLLRCSPPPFPQDMLRISNEVSPPWSGQAACTGTSTLGRNAFSPSRCSLLPRPPRCAATSSPWNRGPTS